MITARIKREYAALRKSLIDPNDMMLLTGHDGRRYACDRRVLIDVTGRLLLQTTDGRDHVGDGWYQIRASAGFGPAYSMPPGSEVIKDISAYIDRWISGATWQPVTWTPWRRNDARLGYTDAGHVRIPVFIGSEVLDGLTELFGPTLTVHADPDKPRHRVLQLTVRDHATRADYTTDESTRAVGYVQPVEVKDTRDAEKLIADA